jgi:hypothetical protein
MARAIVVDTATTANGERLTEIEKAGWLLPLYRELILGDAATVSFQATVPTIGSRPTVAP